MIKSAILSATRAACAIVTGVSRPSHIVFNKCIKVEFPEHIEEIKGFFTFDNKYVTPVMEYEDLKKLAADHKKQDITKEMEYYTKKADDHYYLIDLATQNKPNRDEILKDIREKTFYSCTYEQWDITELVRAHKLTSFDVFRVLVDSVPFGMGFFSHQKNFMTDDKIREAFDSHASGNGYSYFDYWNGIGLKCHFPIDVNNNSTPFSLNMRRYNDRNGYTGYQKIINLLYK
jgi:hypothetical protein